MKPVIEFKGVKKTYYLDRVKVEALRHIDLRIGKGEFAAVVGTSGSGKSTLLHIMGLLDRPSEGDVLFDGIDTGHLSDDEFAEIRGKKIGFIFQFFNLYPTLTARENVELPLLIAGCNSEEKTKKAAELLGLVGLAERGNHMPAQLSGGERQRVAVARALAVGPELILADEPTGNLDSKTGAEIIEMLARINREVGSSIVVVTHDKHIASHAKRIIEIKDGLIISDGKRGISK